LPTPPKVMRSTLFIWPSRGFKSSIELDFM
jgi:hypothetical protein